jgi:hypothetical protein
MVWLVLAVVALTVAGPALATAETISVEATASSGTTVAAEFADPDVANAESLAAADTQAMSGGTFTMRTDLPKPPAIPHPDVPPGSGVVTINGSIMTSDRTNNITFDKFASGDIVLGLGTLTGHAGVYDAAYGSSIYSYAVWSANKTSLLFGRVLREQCLKYRDYPIAYGLWVPSRVSKRSAVRYYCRLQNGEPYDITSRKSDTSRWYCSKLCWAGWRYVGGVDLDADGGYYVWPVDLLNDSQTRVFGRWT